MENKEDKKIQEKYLQQAINELGKGSKLLWIVFSLSVMSSILKSMHTMSYIFIAEVCM